MRFIKNLTFPSKEKCKRTMILARSSADYISGLLHYNYLKEGVQVQVSKPVSDDLQATQFPMDALASDIPWLGNTMEFYYHDPELPSMLMSKFETEEIAKHLTVTKDTEPGTHIIVGMEDETSQYCTLNLPHDLTLDFLVQASAPNMIGAIPLTASETEVMHRMFVLALKVLAFASIPKYAPALLTRKTMHFGGKPGVHNRPKRPAVQVIYLPRVIREHADMAIEAGKSHTFHGRIGHIHHYYSERFTNRKGTWDYMPPLADPVTGKYPLPKVIVKVRKVELV